MNAVVLARYGDPSVLSYSTVPTPTPAKGEVRIRVHAAAVNRVDLDIRAGTSRFDVPLPLILGRECAGVVDQLGLEVDPSLLGARVVVAPNQPCGRCELCVAGADNLCTFARLPGTNVDGGYAEWTIANATGVMRIPSDLDYQSAAATLVSFGTAWRMLVVLARVQPDETVLVDGAAGALGLAGVQIARLCGARVIGVARGDARLAAVIAAGADAAIDYEKEDVVARVMTLTQGDGAHVALEMVGGDSFRRILASLSYRGRAVIAGGHAGEEVGFDLISFFRRELQLFGSRSQSRRDMRTALSLVGTGRLKPQIGQVLGLREAAQAHRLLASRTLTGKLILQP